MQRSILSTIDFWYLSEYNLIIKQTDKLKFDEVIDYGCMPFYKGCLGSR